MRSCKSSNFSNQGSRKTGNLTFFPEDFCEGINTNIIPQHQIDQSEITVCAT